MSVKFKSLQRVWEVVEDMVGFSGGFPLRSNGEFGVQLWGFSVLEKSVLFGLEVFRLHSLQTWRILKDRTKTRRTTPYSTTRPKYKSLLRCSMHSYYSCFAATTWRVPIPPLNARWVHGCRSKRTITKPSRHNCKTLRRGAVCST